jgi:hypothetical protein
VILSLTSLIRSTCSDNPGTGLCHMADKRLRGAVNGYGPVADTTSYLDALPSACRPRASQTTKPRLASRSTGGLQMPSLVELYYAGAKLRTIFTASCSRSGG